MMNKDADNMVNDGAVTGSAQSALYKRSQPYVLMIVVCVVVGMMLSAMMSANKKLMASTQIRPVVSAGLGIAMALQIAEQDYDTLDVKDQKAQLVVNSVPELLQQRGGQLLLELLVDDKRATEALTKFYGKPVSVVIDKAPTKDSEYFQGRVVSNTFDFKHRYFASNPVKKLECDVLNGEVFKRSSLVGMSESHLNRIAMACVKIDGNYRVVFKY